MAAVPWHVSYRIRDSENEIVSIPFFFTTSTGLLADIEAAANGLDPVLDAMLDSQLLQSDIVIPRTLAGTPKTAPNAGGRNEHGAVASFDVSGTLKHYGLDLPSFLPAAIVSKKIDPTNTTWLAFLAYLLAPATGSTLQNEHQQNVTGLFRTFENFRKYRRALVRAR